MEFNLLKMEIACISFVNVCDDSDNDNDSDTNVKECLMFVKFCLLLFLPCLHTVGCVSSVI